MWQNVLCYTYKHPVITAIRYLKNKEKRICQTGNINVVKTKSHSEQVKADKACWFHSAWFQLCLLGTIIFAIVVGCLCGGSISYILAQAALGASLFISLSALPSMPLINPLHAFIALFYWFFGVGPTITGLYYYITDSPLTAELVLNEGHAAVWLIAVGLPLFSIGARLVARQRMPNLGVLRLKGNLSPFKATTILFFFILGAGAELIIFILARQGLGVEFSDMLGGTRVTAWWAGVVLQFEIFIYIAVSFASIALFDKQRQGDSAYKFCMFSIIVLSCVLLAAIDGSKAAIMRVAVIPFIAYISRFQRPPIMYMVLIAATYILVVQPFIDYSRQVVWQRPDATVEDRVAVFFEQLTENHFVQSEKKYKYIRVESPFRFIYELSGEIIRQNNFAHGRWQGQTLWTGLQVVIPRALYPGKPDLNIGNFFAKEIAVPLGLASPFDDQHNIAITLPFEIVGNYGYLAGVVSFFVLGVICAAAIFFFIPKQNLHNHPLAPYLVVSVLQIEGSLGSILGFCRSLIVPLLFLWILWGLHNKRCSRQNDNA